MTARPVVTVIGEALVDLVPDGESGEYRETPGGSPFNVAIGLARLGNRTSLMARFADDRYGRLLRDTAAVEGIDLSAAPHAAERATVATASVDAAARATYDFDMDGTADWQWTDAELHRLHRTPRCSTSARSRPGLRPVARASPVWWASSGRAGAC